MKNYQIVTINEKHITGFNAAVDSVAKEQKYLAFLEGPPMEMTRDFVMENIKGNWPHFVALKDQKIIGWCGITSLHRQALAHAGVLGIGVLSEFRGQGVGNALITAALDKAKSIGLTRIELTVRENNQSAIALYKKYGFEIEGLHRNAIKINGQYENEYCMALLFDS